MKNKDSVARRLRATIKKNRKVQPDKLYGVLVGKINDERPDL